MGMLKEFKDFAMRGNVVDMAVGIVIGTAFSGIVKSIVADIFTPVVAYITGNTDVSGLSAKLPAVVEGQDPATISWGVTAQAIINFLIVAVALFLVVKAMNTLKKEEKEAPAKTPEDIQLLREIRDALQKS
ncbi:MAG: large-conductance mechanosensitive channel protein MscL [Planctomycetota bacterium]